jgi:hypothetical protein
MNFMGRARIIGVAVLLGGASIAQTQKSAPLFVPEESLPASICEVVLKSRGLFTRTLGDSKLLKSLALSESQRTWLKTHAAVNSPNEVLEVTSLLEGSERQRVEERHQKGLLPFYHHDARVLMKRLVFSPYHSFIFWRVKEWLGQPLGLVSADDYHHYPNTLAQGWHFRVAGYQLTAEERALEQIYLAAIVRDYVLGKLDLWIEKDLLQNPEHYRGKDPVNIYGGLRSGGPPVRRELKKAGALVVSLICWMDPPQELLDPQCVVERVASSFEKDVAELGLVNGDFAPFIFSNALRRKLQSNSVLYSDEFVAPQVLASLDSQQKWPAFGNGNWFLKSGSLQQAAYHEDFMVAGRPQANVNRVAPIPQPAAAGIPQPSLQLSETRWQTLADGTLVVTSGSKSWMMVEIPWSLAFTPAPDFLVPCFRSEDGNHCTPQFEISREKLMASRATRRWQESFRGGQKSGLSLGVFLR